MTIYNQKQRNFYCFYKKLKKYNIISNMSIILSQIFRKVNRKFKNIENLRYDYMAGKADNYIWQGITFGLTLLPP